MSSKPARDPQEEAAKMAAMHAWLATVREHLDLETDPLEEVSGPLLDLIRVVAHGPSRPGAPLTAFLAGYCMGQGDEDPAALIAGLTRLAETYEAE